MHYLASIPRRISRLVLLFCPRKRLLIFISIPRRITEQGLSVDKTQSKLQIQLRITSLDVKYQYKLAEENLTQPLPPAQLVY